MGIHEETPKLPETAEPIGPGTLLGQNRVEGHIGRGGMADVFAATHIETGEARAVKVLFASQQDAKDLARFRREFRALRRLDHPNVLRVFGRGVHGDRSWISMERIEGRSLDKEVADWTGLTPTDRFVRAQALLIQIARALQHIHEHGLIHRDLTPSNVIITPNGKAVLTDFGIVRDLMEDTVDTQVHGTAAWIAPEQALSGAVDTRTDLYNLGGILYLMLTGQRPFKSRTLIGFVQKHIHEAPKPPMELEPSCPSHLNAAALRLLAKQPADRFASASHLLHILGDMEPQSPGLWPTQIVGRSSLRAKVTRLLHGTLNEGGGRLLLIKGDSGLGKSQMLDFAQLQAKRLGLPIAKGTCRAGDGPYSAFVQMIQSLDPSSIPSAIQDTLLADNQKPLEVYQIQAAFLKVIQDSTPLVVMLDDFQLADGASRALALYLIRNLIELHANRVSFIICEEPNGSRSLEQEVESQFCETAPIEPLTSSDVEELLLSLLGDTDVSRALAHRLHRETGGTPAYISDMLRRLADDGVIQRVEGRWQSHLSLDDIEASTLPLPTRLRDALRERLSHLDHEALEVGRTLAVSRRPLDLDVLVVAAPYLEDVTLDAVDALRVAGVVQETHREQGALVELSHERFRDVLLSGSNDRKIRTYHRKIAEALERHYRRRPALVFEELSYHFDQAALPTKALAYLRKTAKRHLDSSLFENAKKLLDRAIEMEPLVRPMMVLDEADHALAEIHLGRSQCNFSLGFVDAARVDGQQALTLAQEVGGASLESTVLVELGRQARESGDAIRAWPLVQLALKRAEEAGMIRLQVIPRYQLGALSWAASDLQRAQEHFQSSWQLAQRLGDDSGAAFGSNGLGIVALCAGKTMDARKYLEQSASTFERLGVLGPLAIARTNLSEIYYMTGLLQKALALADRTIAQGREIRHQLGIALGLAHRSRVLSALGRGSEAIENALSSVTLSVELGSREDELVAHSALIRARCEQQRFDEALAHKDRIEDLLTDADAEGLTEQVRGWLAVALAQTGHGPEALRQLEQQQNTRTWPQIRVLGSLSRATAFIALGRLEHGRDALKSALQIAEGNGYRLLQLMAHDGLAQVAQDASTRARHARVAGALSRSLSASLDRQNSESFLAKNWGST